MQEFLPPALPDSEKRRLRELSRFVSSTESPYYCAIPRPADFADDPAATPNPSDDGSKPELNVARLSSDITLTALTQLGVYKFGCMRSYVSLIDGQNQHIISEATGSISLRDRVKHQPNDGLYLGVTTLDLVFGVCPHAVKLFSGHDVRHLQNTDNVTANSTRYIVRDFTREEYFKDRPYVTEWPYFRFYAEVPIYSPCGHILGSYCVVDNKPRSDFSEEDVAALQEVSDAIALHLENVRTVHFHRRSDRLVKGLTAFIKDRPDDETAPLTAANLHSTAVSPGRQSELPQPDHLHLGGLSLTTDLTGGTSPLFSNRDRGDSDATSLSVALHEPVPAGSPPLNNLLKADSPVESGFYDGQMNGSASGLGTPPLAAQDSIPLSTRIANVFARASSVLQESMDVDGVLFVDASWSNSGIVRSKTDLLDWEPLPKNADPRPRSQSPYIPTARPDEIPCDVLGLASNETGSRYPVPDSLLRQLIAALPQGGVLHPDNVSPDSSLLENQLANYFPHAKSLLFVPLWDWNKGQWLAGTFAWTRDSDQERSLGLDELHYFKVFGDSITSEIARLDWTQKEKSKFDLISSMSHELRSPLHGMLANAELLSASSLQPEQREAMNALETCGITLLDTMNNLLDFSKINNLTSLSQGASSITGLVSTFDLDVLVEEVVDSVFSGMRHAATSTTSTPTSSSASEAHAFKRDVSIVLRFEIRDQWKINSMTGAWRRIVMNILGNALRYTDTGFVEVSASLLPPSSDSGSPVAHLRFVDSGCGMSQEFLRNKVFSPFAQEDALSEGAGLGLSVVKQLVSYLNGSIDVKSELGVGTQVDVYIPVQPVSLSASGSVVTIVETAADMEPPKTTFSLIGFGAHPELSEEPTGTLSPAAKRKICLQSFFSNLVADQPSWSVSQAESLEQADGDIAIIEESALKQVYDDESLRRYAAEKQMRFVCLCGGLPLVNENEPVGGSEVVRLYQPFSPRKVLQILKLVAQSEPRPSTMEPCPQSAATLSVETNTSEHTTPNNPVQESRDGSTVLIVDDNDLNVQVLAKLMSKLGYQYTTATNGLVALNKYKESPSTIKVILMDVSMPVMDGIDATKNIRSFEYEHSLPPANIFAVTGIASAAMQQEALRAGVDEYLVKPLSLHQLGSLIKVHM